MNKYGITEDDIRTGEADVIIAQERRKREAEKGSLAAERTDLESEAEDVQARRDRDAAIRDRVRNNEISVEEAKAELPELKATVGGREQASEIAMAALDEGLRNQITQAGETEIGRDIFSNAAGNEDSFFAAESNFSLKAGQSAADGFVEFSLSAPDMAGEFKLAASDDTVAMQPSVDLEQSPENLQNLSQ